MKSTGRAVVLGDNGFSDGGELREGVKAAVPEALKAAAAAI